MGRPREHDETVRAALLLAAERLVDVGGPAALSVRAVADDVGTTTRAVYSVFGSKAGLLEALAIRLFEELGAAIDAIEPTDDPVADVVTASLQGFRRIALEHASLYSLVFLRVVPDLALGPAFDAIAEATFGRLESLVSRAMNSLGVTTDIHAAQMVHALTEGLASMELRGSLGPRDDTEQKWRSAVAALLTGLKS